MSRRVTPAQASVPVAAEGPVPALPPCASRGGYIVVEGPIGAGKTSLARRLAAAYGAELALEDPDANPFLERFYQSPRQFALPAQLFFLFQRSRMLREFSQQDLFRSVHVTDFLFEKDPLFARLTLDDDELRLYDQVYAHMERGHAEPALVIYLQAPPDVLLERIRRRGTPIERGIERRYLERLVEAYTQFFYHYSASPLLVVNAATVNFVDGARDFSALLEHLQTIRSGRHFFNPLPLGL
ncbi:MAG: deoxynucleoside kinase [Acidiferrobacteraceae bacterium]